MIDIIDEYEELKTFESILIHSLRPVQDLAKNWDIDVSSCLEEYLVELHEINPNATVDALHGLQQQQDYDHATSRTNNIRRKRNATQTMDEEEENHNNKNNSTNVRFNFAEAALVVQNSSHVYGRKVDFLYKLVYKHLEELALKTSTLKNKHDRNTNNHKRGSQKDNDIDDFFNHDPYQDFLLLDDVLPTVDRCSDKNDDNDSTNKRRSKSTLIDLDDDNDRKEYDEWDPIQQRRRLRRHSSSGSALLPPNMSKTRLSIGQESVSTTNINSMTVGNVSSFRGSGGSANHFFTNNTIAAHKALIGSLNKSNTLRLVHGGGCDIGENGILLIPGTSTSAQQVLGTDNEDKQNTTTINNNFHCHNDGLDDDDDHNNDGVGFQFVESNDNDGPTTPTTSSVVATATSKRRVTFDVTTKENETSQRLLFTNKNDDEESSRMMYDPWKLLDPHSINPTTKLRPVRVGKTILIPPGLDNMLPSDCVTGSSSTSSTTRRRGRQSNVDIVPVAETATGASISVTPYRRSLALEMFHATIANSKMRSYANWTTTRTSADDKSLIGTGDVTTGLPSSFLSSSSSVETNEQYKHNSILPLRGLVFGNEFAYIANAIAKRRLAERRIQQKQQKQQQHAQQLDDGGTNTIVDMDLAFSTLNNNNNDYYDDDNDNDDNMNNFYSNTDNEQTDPNNMMIESSASATKNGPIETNTGLLSIDEVFQFDTNDNDAKDNDNNNDNQRLTFEELCRIHIQKFARGADKYASETQLSQRVNQWQTKLQPLLEEEEQRSIFDIYQYGVTVIDCIEQSLARKEQRKRQLLLQQKQQRTKDTTANDNIENQNNQSVPVEVETMDYTDDHNHDNQGTTAAVVDFRDITMNCPPYEVCRLFLATLSLCNSENIQFVNYNNTEQRLHPSSALEMQLLKKDIHRPMDTYVL